MGKVANGEYELVRDTESDKSEVSDSEESTQSFDPEKSPYPRLGTFLRGHICQLIIGLIIMSNAVVIGMETDYPDLLCWRAVENVFLVVFAIELVVKIVVFGPRKFYRCVHGEIEWALLDTVVVSMGVVNIVILEIQKHVGSKDHNKGSLATLLRIVRILRLVRVFRLFRFLKKLYLLSVGLIEAAKATFWVTVLMGIILFTCAIVLTRTCGKLEPDTAGAAFLQAQFANVEFSMMSLFQIMASPDLTDYRDNGVFVESPIFLVFVLIWVVFGSFGMIAMLTGVISESMFEKNQARIEEMRIAHQRAKVSIRRWCSAEFENLDKNDMEEVPLQQISDLIPDFKKLCVELEIEYCKEDLDTVTDWMDGDESGLISLPEFQDGMLSVAESGRPVSFQEIKHITNHSKVISEKIHRKAEQIIERLDRIEQRNVRTAEREIIIEGQNQARGSVELTQSQSDSRARQIPTSQSDEVEKPVPAIPPPSDVSQYEVKDSCPPVDVDHLESNPEQPQLQQLDKVLSLTYQCDFDAIRESCESLVPKLNATVACVDAAMAGFERLSNGDRTSHLQGLVGSYVFPVPRIDVASSADFRRDFGDKSSDSADNVEVVLAKLAETLRTEVLARVAESTSAQKDTRNASWKPLVAELISQLSLLLVGQPTRATAYEPDPEVPDTGRLLSESTSDKDKASPGKDQP